MSVGADHETAAFAVNTLRSWWNSVGALAYPAQDHERVAWGPAWNEAGLVFTRENGLPLRPEYATRHFQALPQEAGPRQERLVGR